MIEIDFDPGKTETEAPESTRNALSDKISSRNRREEQQTSSGTGAGTGARTGSGTGRTGWTGSSTCRITSIQSPSKASCRLQPSHHAPCKALHWEACVGRELQCIGRLGKVEHFIGFLS